jgi:alpha-L-arabinofuranosidase
MIAGDPNWTDYTYSLKALKTGGAEGFRVLFHAHGPDDFILWNIGGWQNSSSTLEKSGDDDNRELAPSAPLSIDNNRWYDIRVELKGADIKCYLDDKLIVHATDAAPAPLSAIYATASRVDSTGQVILKVVNVTPLPQNLQINLNGAKEVGRDAHLVLLTGEPQDVNTIDEPRKIAPRELRLDGAAPSFVHEFPAYSVSVLKLAVK